MIWSLNGRINSESVLGFTTFHTSRFFQSYFQMIFRIRVFPRDISNYAFHVDIVLVSQRATLNLMVYSLYMCFFRKIPKLVSLKMGHPIEKQRIVIVFSPPAAQRASCWVQRPHWWFTFLWGPQNVATMRNTLRYNSLIIDYSKWSWFPFVIIGEFKHMNNSQLQYALLLFFIEWIYPRWKAYADVKSKQRKE